MRRTGWFLGAIGALFLVLAVAVACVEPTASASQGPVAPATEAKAALAALGSSQQTGIWVSGLGRVTVQPDLAIVTLGVEARATTVAEARAKAAQAMTDIMDALKKQGVADKDVQTRFFNIQPQYVWKEKVGPMGERSGEQVLVGYIVTNQVVVKLRNLEKVGDTVDAVAEAGGDLTRIQGISFTVEDPTPHQTQARELALKDAMAKAKQMAEVTGVTLGKPIFISESGGGVPVVRDFAAAVKLTAGAAPAPMPATPIGTGELDIQTWVQIVFSLQ